MKIASAYLRRSRIVVRANGRTRDGFWIETGPAYALVDTASDAEIGHAIRAALLQSGRDVPVPANWKLVLDPLLRAFSIKTWATLVKGCTHCSIEMAVEAISVIPSRNLGARDGFQAMTESSRALATNCTDDELGSAVRTFLTASV